MDAIMAALGEATGGAPAGMPPMPGMPGMPAGPEQPSMPPMPAGGEMEDMPPIDLLAQIQEAGPLPQQFKMAVNVMQDMMSSMLQLQNEIAELRSIITAPFQNPEEMADEAAGGIPPEALTPEAQLPMGNPPNIGG